MTNPDRSELVKLADELDGWHDCADGDVHAGNGHFRLVCVHDSEQQRLNLRATLREVSTALRRLASSDGGVKGEPVAWQVLIKLQWITLPSDWTLAEAVNGQTYRALYTAPPADAGMREAYSAFQRIAADCHRSKWHFDINAESPPNVYDARRLVHKAFDELQRIGNIAMHERDELPALTAPGATTKSDVEALAATTAERPGTVTSEPEPSTSDTPPVPQAVKAVGVDTIARICADDLVPIIETATRVANRTGNTFVIDRQKVATMIAGHFNRALLAKFKMEGR